MKELWILCLLTSGFLPGSSERLTPWVDTDFDSLQDEYRFTRNMSWWDAAYTGCDDVNEVLLPDSSISSKLRSKMVSGQYYWIGISEVYTPWKWTADESFLFVNKGSLEVSGYGNNRTSLLANEPYLCHKQCKKGPVGLQGKYCYCLSTDVNLTNHVTDFRCPGAYSQYCGSEKTMSVYDIDIPNNVSFVHSNNAMCGYVDYQNSYKKLELKLDKSCHAYMHYACPKNEFYYTSMRVCNDNSAHVCVSTNRKVWNTAKRYCKGKLIKLSDDTMADLLALTSKYRKGFWIDLRRSTEWKWIDGYNANYKRHLHYDLDALKCFLIMKNNFNIVDVYKSYCTNTYSAICQKYKPTPTTSTRTSTTEATTSTTTSTTTSRYESSSSSEKTTLPTDTAYQTTTFRYTVTPSSSDNTTETLKHFSEDGSSDGLIAGVVVGVILLMTLAAVVVLVWMKRTHRYCFHSSKNTQPETVTSRDHTSSSRPNNDYELPGFTNSVYTQEQTYCTIQSDSALTSDKSNSPVYENNNVLHNNHKLTKPHVPRPATDTPGHQPNTARAENAATTSEPPKSSITRLNVATEQLAGSPDGGQFDYQLAGSPDGGQSDYQLAGSPDGGQFDYQLAGSPDEGQFDNELSGSNEGGPVAGSNDGGIYEYEEVDNAGFSDEYNTLHDTVRDVRDDGNYSHLGASQLTEDMYNTTQPQREHVDNDVYSHVTGDTFVNEDEYSHMTGSHDVHAQNDPEYSHLGTQ